MADNKLGWAHFLEQPNDKYLMEKETLPNFIIARKHRPDDKPSVCNGGYLWFYRSQLPKKKEKKEAEIMQ